MKKNQVPSEEIEFPKLERLDPGSHYQGSIKLTLGAFYTPGHTFLVHLSMFYFGSEEMDTILRLLKETEPERMGLYLQDLEKALTDEPVRLVILG